MAVAPMLDYTDRHCRFFHRQFTKSALLYTEMVVADAIIHGNRDILLSFSPQEHPIALQLGGSCPIKLAQAAAIGEAYGYDEINLNVGCPSSRVQAGAFGASLMLEPERVGRCISAMKTAVKVPVTIKCRIGVDEQDTHDALWQLAHIALSAGVDGFWVHARKAWLKGLSPKENRTIPPLDYPLVYEFKQEFSDCYIGINGAIDTKQAMDCHLKYVDGVMLGRAVYKNPKLLASLTHNEVNMQELLYNMVDYLDAHLAKGGRMAHILKHMSGLFYGTQMSSYWRQQLSRLSSEKNNKANSLVKLFQEIEERNG